MAKRLNSKFKAHRRAGFNLTSSEKSAVIERKYVPGQHGPTNPVGKAGSDYNKQLRGKQALKFSYGDLSEKRMRKCYEEAARRRGDTGQNLIGILESMLLAVVFRGKLAPSPFAARQLVNHKHILVNGKCVNIGSYRVKAGDVISVKESSKDIPAIVQEQNSKFRDLPDYITADDADSTKITFNRVPKLEDVPYGAPIEPNLVVEFYSR